MHSIFFDQTGDLTGLGKTEMKQTVFPSAHCNCDIEPHSDSVGKRHSLARSRCSPRVTPIERSLFARSN